MPVKLASHPTDLERLLGAALWYANRDGFGGRLAPLLRRLEDRVQVLVFTSEAALERFAKDSGLVLEAVRLEPNDWRAREEFLRAAADQGAVELLADHGPDRAGTAYRLGRAMLEVELQKTNSACL